VAEPIFRLRLSQAARMAGVHKTTIWRAINSGRLSATVGNDGRRRVDASELDRLYGPLQTDAQHVAHALKSKPAHTAPAAASDEIVAQALEALRHELSALRQDNDDLKRQVQQWQDIALASQERERRLLEDKRPDRPTPTTTARKRRSSPPKPAETPALGDLLTAAADAFSRSLRR